ncbi:MAG TPA: immunoglobulin domain-containing protein [Verrucomicrobiae bacterium]|jgi:hypothetical protein
MNPMKLPNCKLLLSVLCLALLPLAGAAQAATISTIGANAPVPGPDDQFQTNFIAAAISPPPGGGGFNYYMNANPSPGQTFTTGSSVNGYVLNSLALYDADNTGGGFGNETFTLGIYSVSGSAATLVATYTSQSLLLTNFTWFQWTNLGAVLQPNTQYAYAMWANGAGWCNLGNTNASYAGGQVALVPRTGGTMTFSSSSPWNASFDVGLTAITGVTVGQATFSSGVGVAVVSGTSVTASASVNGPTPYTFQWQTDGGTGGTLTNIPGATSANLAIDTTGFADGYYQYDLIVSNGVTSATGQVGVLQIQSPIGIPGVIAVKFGFAAGYATMDAPASGDNTGPTLGGQLVPPSYVPLTEVGNWNILRADVVGAGSAAAAINQTWTIDHDTTGSSLSGVTLTPFGWNDGWYSGGTGCAAGRLLYDCWKFNQNGANPQFDGGGRLYSTLTFNNLPGAKYDVIVFVNDNNGNYWGNMQANDVIAQGATSVDDSGHGFNGASSDPCSLPVPLHTFSSFNGANAANSCNYVLMQNVTTSGGAITITVVSFGGGDMGIAGVELVPSPDLTLVQNIDPNYAEAMVGDPLSLSVAFADSPAVNFQWFKVSHGVTNIVAAGVSSATNSGVVTSTLSFNSLQTGDSAVYLAQAINAGNSADYLYTSAATLVVSNAPAPLNNVILYQAAQASANYFPANWTIDASSDLIFGFQWADGSPGTALADNGNFGADGSNPDGSIMSDGLLGVPPNGVVSCGPQGGWNTNMIYALQTNSTPAGFDITNITVYGGWLGGGRRDQAYQVLYATVADPATFIPLYTAEYLPDDPNGGPIASRTKLVPASGPLARNVAAVMINWDVPQLLNGYSFYSEIEINGSPSTATVATTAANINSVSVSGGNLILTGSGGIPSNAGYTLLSTTNLTPPIQWTSAANGVLDATGSFSNSIPINASGNAEFFKWSSP